MFRIALAIATISIAYSADTPEGLRKETSHAFQRHDASALHERVSFTIITGDIPLGRGLFNPSIPCPDPDGLHDIFPRLYKTDSISLLSDTDARAIETSKYVDGRHLGYIRVDFKRDESLNPKAQITAFARFLPYHHTSDGFFLDSKK